MRISFGLSLLTHLCGMVLLAAFMPHFRHKPPTDVYVVAFGRLDMTGGNHKSDEAAAGKSPVKTPEGKTLPPATGVLAPAVALRLPLPVTSSLAPPMAEATLPAHLAPAREKPSGSDQLPAPVTALRGMITPAPGGGTSLHPGIAVAPSSGGASPRTKGADGVQKTNEVAFGSEAGPAFLYRSLPVYPTMARRFGKEGRVVLRLTIDEAGALIHAEVVEDPGYGLAGAAMDAAKKSRFSPARRDGRPITVKTILPVRFNLKAMAAGE